LTGCFSALVLLPSEVIKAKTQVVVGDHSSQEIMRKMMKQSGIKVRVKNRRARKKYDACIVYF